MNVSVKRMQHLNVEHSENGKKVDHHDQAVCTLPTRMLTCLHQEIVTTNSFIDVLLMHCLLQYLAAFQQCF